MPHPRLAAPGPDEQPGGVTDRLPAREHTLTFLFSAEPGATEARAVERGVPLE